MKTLLVVLLVSGAAWAAAADNRIPTKTCTVWIRAGLVRLDIVNPAPTLKPSWIMFDDSDEVRVASCAADPKLTSADRLVWAKVLQEMIERRYDRDMEEAVK